MNNINLIRIPDQRYNVWLDTSLKTIRINNSKNPIQIFKDSWHKKLDKDYVSKCLGEPLKRSNWVHRVVHYVLTSDGEEGFIPVPKYSPLYFHRKDRNPPILYLYKVDKTGLYYFK